MPSNICNLPLRINANLVYKAVSTYISCKCHHQGTEPFLLKQHTSFRCGKLFCLDEQATNGWKTNWKLYSICVECFQLRKCNVYIKIYGLLHRNKEIKNKMNKSITLCISFGISLSIHSWIYEGGKRGSPEAEKLL